MSPAVLLEGRRLPIHPCGANKVPTSLHGHLDATADPKEIALLWLLNPGTLIGVATGAISGIVAVDIDLRRGGDRWYHENHDRLGKTRTHETPSGGWHLIFKNVPGLRASSDRFASGVEVRANGSHIIWWPAHAGRVLCEGPVADFPAWLLELAMARPERHWPEVRTNGGGGRLVGSTDPLPRDLYLLLLQLVPTSATVSSHDQRCVRGLLSVVVHAAEGVRNNKLNWSAFKMRQYVEAGIISRENAEALLMQAAAGLAASDGEASVWATIQSGLGASATSLPRLADIREPDA